MGSCGDAMVTVFSAEAVNEFGPWPDRPDGQD
jgi:hypothetical protein